MFAPELAIEDNKWQHRDIGGMAQYANSSPVLLDADASKGSSIIFSIVARVESTGG